MATTYRECEEDVADMADTIMRRWHAELIEAGVTIKYLFHTSENPLKLHGVPCAAIVKINSYKNRVLGLTDAQITIDEEWWNNHTNKQCEAVLDHELFHLMVAHDDDGKIITDDCERPKLRMRPHDVEVGEFNEIVRRHKKNCPSVDTVGRAMAIWIQGGLDFSGNDMEASPEKEAAEVA